MIEFRDRTCQELGLKLIVYTNREAIAMGSQSFPPGHQQVLRPVAQNQGAARCTHRARNRRGDWRCPPGRRKIAGRKADLSPSATLSANGTRKIKDQNYGTFTTAEIDKGQSVRIFPLSNWTELDVWEYIQREKFP